MLRKIEKVVLFVETEGEFVVLRKEDDGISKVILVGVKIE